MANVCNKDQNRRESAGQQAFGTIESMLSDLVLYTSNACSEKFQDEDLSKPRKPTECHSLQRVVSDNDVSMSADRVYDRLMETDFERSYILVPHSIPKMLETSSDQPPFKSRGQPLRLSDDQFSVATGRTSASERTESESEARTPIVKEKKKKERKSEQRTDSNRPSAAPSYMTVINNNLDEVSKASSVIDAKISVKRAKQENAAVIDNNLDDLEVSKASTFIDAGFDAKISVKRKGQDMCKLDLAADVANGTIRCLRINRKTYRV